MTAPEFRTAILALGHTQRSFARHVGVDERSVGRWARGDVPVPRWVEVLLGLMMQIVALQRAA